MGGIKERMRGRRWKLEERATEEEGIEVKIVAVEEERRRIEKRIAWKRMGKKIEYRIQRRGQQRRKWEDKKERAAGKEMGG